MTISNTIKQCACMASLCAFVGCMADVTTSENEAAVAAEAQALTPASAAATLTFTELPAPAGKPELRVLITDADQYRKLFAAAPPAAVNFRAGEALIFYSAGERRTGGFSARIESIARAGETLRVTTQLESPGPACLVTQSITNPRVMVKFKRPARATSTRFTNDDIRRDCTPSTCDTSKCPTGQHCEMQAVECVRAPCDPVPTCVDDRRPLSCGGFLGTPCPGAGLCVDDPSDDCDPDNGGADCAGICTCKTLALCEGPGASFDASPDVCVTAARAPS